MGTIATRLALLAALAGALAPAGAGATTTYREDLGPPFTVANQGGDAFNQVMVDPDTGEMTVVRLNAVPTNAGLGCGGSGGFANFGVTSDFGDGPAVRVEVEYADALVDPYTFLTVGVRDGGDFAASASRKGPIAGEGTFVIDLRRPPATTVDGPVTVWFGIQVSSACPNVDGGRARFERVTVWRADPA